LNLGIRLFPEWSSEYGVAIWTIDVLAYDGPDPGKKFRRAQIEKIVTDTAGTLLATSFITVPLLAALVGWIRHGRDRRHSDGLDSDDSSEERRKARRRSRHKVEAASR